MQPFKTTHTPTHTPTLNKYNYLQGIYLGPVYSTVIKNSNKINDVFKNHELINLLNNIFIWRQRNIYISITNQ